MPRKTIEERFWAKVDRSDPDGCWPWLASVRNGGYGQFGVTSKKIVTASHFAWESVYGPVPTGLCVLHKCDNPICVRPDSAPGADDGHLFVGTRGENNADCWSKGRSFYQKNGGAHNQRLSASQVEEMFSLRAEGASLQQLADQFDTDRKHVERIVNGASRGDGRFKKLIKTSPPSRVPVEMKLEKGVWTFVLTCGHVVTRVVPRQIVRCWSCLEAS